MSTGNENPLGNPRVTTLERKDKGGEFGRFQDLARKLVAVPKAEVDEKRGSSKRDR